MLNDPRLRHWNPDKHAARRTEWHLHVPLRRYLLCLHRFPGEIGVTISRDDDDAT